MAIQFDGDNLVITLDSGVTQVDVFEDLYEAAKDWYRGHPDNRRYPFPFVSDGGNPLTEVINQGGYIFLRNDIGWRIRPPEEDITIYITGNLAVSNVDLPAFIPTVGDFTAAIIGLQPVTQGVTPAMRQSIEFASLANQVAIDPINGYALTAAVDGVLGTRKFPLATVADANTQADINGIRQFTVMNNTTVANITMPDPHQWIGDTPNIVLTLDSTAGVAGHSYRYLTVVGELDNTNLIEFCQIGAVTQFSGFASKSAFLSSCTLGGNTFVAECYSLVPGNGHPEFFVGLGNDFQVRDWHGSIGLNDIQDGTHTIEVYGGFVNIEASCTGGTIHIRGNPVGININGTVGANVVYQDGDRKITQIWQANRLDPDNPVETDEDGTIRIGPNGSPIITINAGTVGTTPNRTTTQTRA